MLVEPGHGDEGAAGVVEFSVDLAFEGQQITEIWSMGSRAGLDEVCEAPEGERASTRSCLIRWEGRYSRSKAQNNRARSFSKL